MVISAGQTLLDSNYLLKEILKIGSGQRVADLGCGATAINSLTAAKLVGEKGQVFAVDILKTVLSSVESHARHEGLINIKTVWADLEKLGSTKIADNSMDFVFLINILFQAKDRLTVLKEAARICKTDGKILIVEWQARDEGIGPAVDRRLSEENAKNLINSTALKIINSFSAGQHHYGLIVQK